MHAGAQLTISSVAVAQTASHVLRPPAFRVALFSAKLPRDPMQTHPGVPSSQQCHHNSVQLLETSSSSLLVKFTGAEVRQTLLAFLIWIEFVEQFPASFLG